MSGMTFSTSLPRAVRFRQMADLEMFPAATAVEGVFVPVAGDIFGTALLLFSGPDARKVSLRLLGALAPGGAATGGLMAGALEEAVNVFVNATIGVPSRELGLSIYSSPPRSSANSFSSLFSELMMPQRDAMNSDGTGDYSVFHANILCTDLEAAVHFVLCVSRESLNAIKTAADVSAPKRIDVGMGEIRLGKPPDILRAASLGSCLAIILYDPRTKAGAMAHVMLPTSPTPDPVKPGKYANTAVAALLKELNSPGRRVAAWLVGGASMFPQINKTPVGKSNLDVARESIRLAGIERERVCEDVGGCQGRTVELFLAIEEVWVRSRDLPQRLSLPLARPAAPRRP